MNKHSRVLMISLSIILLWIAFPSIAYSNAAEPPGLLVTVSNPPGDLSLSLKFPGGEEISAIQLQKEKKAWETYYRFFYHASPVAGKLGPDEFEGAVLMVEGSGIDFELALPGESFSRYNNLLTLDLEKEHLITGQPPYRVPSLVALRLFLTLLIEGAVFFLFGFREKRSWLIFLGVNLLSQGSLNAMITGPGLASYWMIGFILGEIAVLVAEIIAFILLVKEYKKSRIVLYTITANIASLILGGFLITYLPV